MWKAILFRRPLRRIEDDRKIKGPPPGAGTASAHPFADLMEKLDRIPYRRQWKHACDH